MTYFQSFINRHGLQKRYGNRHYFIGEISPHGHELTAYGTFKE